MKKLILFLAILGLTCLASAQWIMNEGFESTTLPTGWTIHDEGDGMAWRSLNNVSHAHTGNRAAFCDNYLPNLNHDWLITPLLNITPGDSLYFYTRSWIDTENLKVYVSTSGPSYTNFTTQIVSVQGIGTAYQLSQTSLSAYAGQSIYLGFYWECTSYGILVDDVKVGHPSMNPPILNLPDSYSFIQGTSLAVDFTPFVTTTSLSTASLTVSGNNHVGVAINGLNVTFTSPIWNGTETLLFTLHDNSNGLQGTDTVQLIVAPIPTVDLGLAQVNYPRNIEYLSHLIYPSVKVSNLGNAAFTNSVEVSCNITDSLGASLYTQTVTSNDDIAYNQSFDINFLQSWTPSATGTYIAHFNLITADQNMLNNVLPFSFAVVYRVMEGGPDSFGYRWIDSNAEGGPAYVWNDISQTGLGLIMNGVSSFAGDDNFCETVTFGFPFPFYGIDYLTFNADVNGEILLAPNNWYEPYPDTAWDFDGNVFNYMYPIPGYVQMPALIAVLWDDLEADQGTGDIYFQSFGTYPDRYAVIQWNNMRFHAGSGGSPVLKFQTVLHESGEIEFYYHTTQNGITGTVAPHENGRSATVAIQNQTADIGLCYLREIVQNNSYIGVQPAGNLLHDGLAIRFYNGSDTQPPVITHSQPGNTFELNPVIKAHFLDFSNIQSAVLHYNYSGNWQTVLADHITDSDYFFNLPQLPQGVTLQYYFSASDEHGNASLLPVNAPEAVFSFEILPGNETHVLLLYSGHQDYDHVEQPVYEAILTQLQIPYDIYDWQEFASYAIPAQYKTVICYASTGSGGADTDNLSNVLMQFMESGTTAEPKNVFFSSDGFAFSQGGTPNNDPKNKLLNAYFRTFYAPTGGGGGTNGLSGPDVNAYANGTIKDLAGSHIGTEGSLFNVYANSPDCIFAHESCPDWYADQVQYPAIGAHNAFTFEGGPIDGHAYLYHGVCATWIDLNIYRAFYFSFDLSQLSNPTQRTLFMHDLFTWFDTPVGNSDVVVIAPKTELMQNYPNPFNPETKIIFSTASNSLTKLEIYNVKGQLVKTLVNGNLPVGKHDITWNGKDDQDHQVASGVYFYRMSHGDIMKTRRMLLLK